MLKRLLISVLLLLCLLMFYRFDTLYIFENNFTDRLVSDTRTTDNRIKILAIDDVSLQEYGRWPWPRERIATLMDELLEHQATAVWADILYTERSENEEEDAYMQELLDRHDNMYLSLYFQFPTRQLVRGELEIDQAIWPVYEMGLSQLGHINVMEDQDRVVRRLMLGIRDEQETVVPAISVRLANYLLAEEEQIRWDEQGNWYRGDKPLPTGAYHDIRFSYASSPHSSTFEVISIRDVMEGDIPYSYFENAVVLIGPYAAGLLDSYYTPTSNTLQMHGVEIHANVIQSLVDGEYYEEFPQMLGLLLMVVVFGISMLSFEWFRAMWASVLMVVYITSYTLITIILYISMQLLLPVLYPLLAIILAYISSVVYQYGKERLERKRVTNVFGRYVSKSVVHEILSSQDEVTVGGQRKDVTLMFVDIRGFTPLSEQAEPEEVINILNEYLELCTQAIFKYEGTIDKFMGDGIMAIFGAPIEQEDHAHRAIHTALRMKENSERLYERLKKEYGRSVQFGMGIHSGMAIIGNVGSQERLDYTAIGDTVNLAARLESNAKGGQILISVDTFERIKDQFECQALPPIKVKGKQEPVEVYQVEKVKNSKEE